MAAAMGDWKHWEIVEDRRGVEGGGAEQELLRMRARSGDPVDPVAVEELVKTEAPVVVLEEVSDHGRGPNKSGNSERDLTSGEKREPSQVVNSPENCHVTGKRGPPERSNLRSKLQSQEEAAGRGTPVKGAHSVKLWVFLVFVPDTFSFHENDFDMQII
ncbi:predicted protein [Arabidopsis lyrata subsp. lyrata]|uniref:Predicted protein n=1 Tax=Arabidopsis lyrata subsp. lyrata TaxID=81972 RepID=D7LQU2_ARALL|nr:predicted protein [Arabidopsis lyrata subsp. lyrata]